MNDAYQAALEEAAEQVTGDNCSIILAGIDAAYESLRKTEFAAWCKSLIGATVSGTKQDMHRQARAFIKRLAVTEVQCRF